MTRAEQDAILVPIVRAYAIMANGPANLPVVPASLRTLSSFRAALRLDDPVLDAIIARGEKLEWTTSGSPASLPR